MYGFPDNNNGNARASLAFYDSEGNAMWTRYYENGWTWFFSVAFKVNQ